MNTPKRRLEKLEANFPADVADVAGMSDAELIALIGDDAEGRWIRSLTDAQLQAIVEYAPSN